jgi:hypothetical protein
MQVARGRGDPHQLLVCLVALVAVQEEVSVDRLDAAARGAVGRGAVHGVRVELHEPHLADAVFHVLDVARELGHVAEGDARR